MKVPKSASEVYALSYASFVVPLVKAVQEQQSEINEKDKKINALQQQMDSLQQQINDLKKMIEHK